MKQIQADLAAAVEHRDTEIFGVGGAPGDGPVLPENTRVGLVESGARRQLAKRLGADASMDAAAWTRVAYQAGLSVAEIARLAGATRATVYAWLDA